ncbi:MAG: poly[(R)-3-hydroxyalkanoate] polymerase subunit PhaC [Solirubrobacteraceae bacterium]|jgi:polyhydroxyalkanoate synthase|nr:poly[(R)-3-hydroxyalkanoate] polymerase subunit PhaC [Solirubrobacteraceae bacterium]
MSAIGTLARVPAAAFELANVILTVPDAAIGQTPRDVVWTHRETTLYRYRSNARERPIPVLLVFALINRPEIFDLRRGSSFVEFLLADGFDVFLVDWGVPDEEDADMGLADYVCDELHWAVRETLRAAGEEELTLLGWCIGGTLCAMYCALHPVGAARNAVLLTTPIDPSNSLYARWVGHDDFDVDLIAERYRAVPGGAIDWANKLMKPVTNYATTYRRLFQSILDGNDPRLSYQPMAKWVADNPPFPSRAYREWITWIYKENRLVAGRVRLRGEGVDLRRIEQNLLVVTAGADHIAPPEGTLPILDLVCSDDVTHFDRPGGHIGLMAGSRAKHEIWPDLADWLRERSNH